MRFSCYFEENFLENEHIVLSSVLCNEKERTINVELIGDELLSIVSFKKLLKGMDKLSNELGITLPKGANPLVDEVGKKIVAKYGKDKLNKIAKLNFKNTDKILNS